MNGCLLIDKPKGITSANCVYQLRKSLGIKKIGLGLASIHMNATAFYVMIILSFFGGSWNNYQLVGALIVGIGVFISQSSKKSFIT